MKKKENKLPDLNKMSRKELAEWFDTHSMADYWDEMEDVKVVVDLDKPKEKTLVLRLQEGLKKRLDRVAKSKGLTVSSLARMWLMEKLQTVHS
jgi:16S rRNA U516 pseudouridylate synthase RsuA-like enzyme